MAFLLPLLFSPVQLTSLCSLWKIIWQVLQIIAQSLPGKKPSPSVLCSYAPHFFLLCTFSVSSATGVQKYFRLRYHSRKGSEQQEEYAAKNTMMRRGQKPAQLGAELGQIDCRHFMMSLIYLAGTQQPEWMGAVWSAVLSAALFSSVTLKCTTGGSTFLPRNSADCMVECGWVSLE